MKTTIAKTKVRVAQAAAVYATYEATAKVSNQILEKAGHMWTVDADYNSTLHSVALDQVVNHLPPNPMRRTKTSVGYDYEGGVDGAFPNNKWVWFPIRRRGLFTLQARMRGSYLDIRSPRKRDLDTFVEMVTVMADAEDNSEEPKITLEYRPRTMIKSWDASAGTWEYRANRSSRTFDSVILPADLQAELVADLTRFTESQQRLRRLEMPWRRGYLLSGPPGTGKTSVSLAIAANLGFELASLSLTDIESDGELRKAVSTLGSNVVLVIEDIDAYSVSNDREHNAARDGALSLSGLLNSLDGFETPDGLVTICTTNHVEHLDAALIREGRLDRTFTLDYICATELERLFFWFYEEKSPTSAPTLTKAAQLSPASVAEVFKQHLEDPQAGWAAILERIEPGRHLSVVA